MSPRQLRPRHGPCTHDHTAPSHSPDFVFKQEQGKLNLHVAVLELIIEHDPRCSMFDVHNILTDVSFSIQDYLYLFSPRCYTFWQWSLWLSTLYAGPVASEWQHSSILLLSKTLGTPPYSNNRMHLTCTPLRVPKVPPYLAATSAFLDARKIFPRHFISPSAADGPLIGWSCPAQ